MINSSSGRVFAVIGIVDKMNHRLTEPVFVKGQYGGKTVEALVDTGAQRSLIDVYLANEIGARLTGRANNVGGLEHDTRKLEAEVEIFTGNSTTHRRPKGKKGELYFKIPLTIWEDLKERVGFPLLLGMDFLLSAEKNGEQFTIEIG